MAQWFLLKDEKVEGPYSTEEIRSWAEAHPSETKVLVWGKPQLEWRPIQWWVVEAPALLSQMKQVKDDRLWHYAVEGKSFGPFSRADLILQLRDAAMSQDLLLWTKGMAAWAPIFEFHDILNEIGVNRRQYPRADIDGQVKIQHNGQLAQGQLLTISEGGMGFTGGPRLNAGQVLSVELESDSFYDPIHVKIEVRYVTESGFVGCRFQGLSSESRSAIIQYVRQSGKTVVRPAA